MPFSALSRADYLDARHGGVLDRSPTRTVSSRACHVRSLTKAPSDSNSTSESGHRATYSITSSARASSDGGTVEAERLGGLEIDHQLVLGRRLHRQVGWLLALEDAIDVAGRAPVLVDEIRPIGDQAAGGDEDSVRSRPRAACAGPPA